MPMGMPQGMPQGMPMAQALVQRPPMGKGKERGQRQGDWLCSQCGNMNFADRAFCNMRKCSAPRQLTDWVCSCGNTNYADRAVCNMRRCGLPRNDVHPDALALLASRGLGKGGGKVAMPPIVDFGIAS
uniref:RanBP2-type domain-containing protein n=1 Tax=Alexandrium catenella TaxID=2925 RepID=A0A7S1MID5_ALECA|mmetsp:Transcript_27116/g.73592  ORF Transcript_27116/g.73592 Transcript_27116/m.73592 type:complete len:128 (+) Transcript_27116:3-386(+)